LNSFRSYELRQIFDGIDVVVAAAEIETGPLVSRTPLSLIHGYTLFPGNWPPSPGLAPCAILIWRSVQFTR
jgi:hypothetical protein